MKMYYAFIVNPAAGTGFALTTMQKLEEKLTAASVDYRVFRTERPGHATELAAKLAADEEITAVVSVGGDGTAGEVAAGLTGTGKPMGIIPAGTGNDFIKTAGIPNDPEKPSVTSGVRIGTPAVTTRGLGQEEMKIIAKCIAMTARDFEGTSEQVRATVKELCEKFPLYK